MDPNAVRRGNRAGRTTEADVYWRRRFVALAAAVAVVGLLIWAVSGSGGGASHRTAGPGRGNGQSQAAYGQTASPTASPTASHSATPSPSASAPAAGKGKHAKARPSASPSPAATGKHGSCLPSDVVLSLFTAKTSYSGHELPQFQIDVVSTGPAECTFDAGPAALRLVVKSEAGVAWTSDACVYKPSAKIEKLRRGVPLVMSVTWNRRLSGHGCGKEQAYAMPGKYVAVAQGGKLTSHSKAFEIR